MKTSSENGFTLIEIITTLVLLGGIVLVAGLAIIQGVEGFTLARENADLSQKAQLAFGRINREFENLIDISLVNETGEQYICYSLRTESQGPDQNRCIGRVDDEIRIINGTTPPAVNTGHILTDQVSDFKLDFYLAGDDVTAAGTWITTSPITDLNLIKIGITFDHKTLKDISLNLETFVIPRRSGRYNALPKWNE